MPFPVQLHTFSHSLYITHKDPSLAGLCPPQRYCGSHQPVDFWNTCFSSSLLPPSVKCLALWLLNAWHMSAVRIWLMTCLIVLSYQEEPCGITCNKSLSKWGNRSLNEHFCEGDFPHWHYMYSTKSNGDRNSLKKTRSSICQYFLIYNVTIMLC